MMSYPLNGVNADGSGQVLWEDGECVFRRGRRMGDDDNRSAVLVVQPDAEHPSPSSLDRLTHEYGLKDELDGAWAVRPLDPVREDGLTVLVLKDAGCEPLDRLLRAPMELGRFLRLAVGIATDDRLSRLQLLAVNSTDLAAVASLRMALYTTDRPDRAVEVGVEQLRIFGIEWSAHPTEVEARA